MQVLDVPVPVDQILAHWFASNGLEMKRCSKLDKLPFARCGLQQAYHFGVSQVVTSRHLTPRTFPFVSSYLPLHCFKSAKFNPREEVGRVVYVRQTLHPLSLSLSHAPSSVNETVPLVNSLFSIG